jgi:nitrite reductase/ring-hydroxylating ferredoxin subunit
MPFTTVASVQDVMEGKIKQVQVQGRTIALFHVDGSIFAIDNQCTHRGGPLSEGELAGKVVTCPWHGAHFDVTTGAHLSPPAPADVAPYKVQIVGSDVQVEVA